MGTPGRSLLAASPHCHRDVASVALAIGEAPRTILKLAPPCSLARDPAALRPLTSGTRARLDLTLSLMKWGQGGGEAVEEQARFWMLFTVPSS